METTLLDKKNPEDLALVDNKIEDDFYEALEQRGIENYDKAIVSIQNVLKKNLKMPRFIMNWVKTNWI